MRKGRPSTTAAAVAWARAVASLPGRGRGPAVDEAASSMLPAPLGHALRALGPLSARSPAVQLALRVGSLGFVDHLGLRTAALDDALADATLAGVRQLVLLGAGLDARAYRLPGLEEVVVFEVDHPATQREKRARAARLTPRAQEVRFVAVDFERERIEARLRDEGHDASAPTMWIWEGVVPYLEPAATRATLASVAAISAPGSRLALTYVVGHRLFRGPLSRPVELAFQLLGEPLRSLTSRDALHTALDEAGWHPLEDTGPHDWRRRYRWGIDALLLLEERLVLAER